MGSSGEEVPRTRMSPATIAAKVSDSSPARPHLHSQVSARMQLAFRTCSSHLDGDIQSPRRGWEWRMRL